MKTILLIGTGAWGQKYIKTILPMNNIILKVANRHNWPDMIDQKPDGVIVCTPPATHIKIADYSLSNGIPTMIEKPLSLSLEECKIIYKYKLPILVNHIHLFSDVYQNIKKIIDVNGISEINSIGTGPGSHKEYSTLWDYGPHDISYMLDLTNQIPKEVNIGSKLDSKLQIILKFENFISHSIVGNSADRVRKLTVRSNGIDFLYDDIIRPKDHASPLTNAINVFLASIDGKDDYRLGLDLSMKIMSVLDLCEKSIIV